MELYLAKTRGFCAGVARAIDTLEALLERHGPPIYVRHAIVHNNVIVKDLTQRGAIFVEDIEEVPDGALAMMSAHGVARKVYNASGRKSLQMVDGTCPLVTKVHLQARMMSKNGLSVVVIGHRNHVEVEGILGHVTPQGEAIVVETVKDVAHLNVRNADKIGYVTQTTLAQSQTDKIIVALRARFPALQAPHGNTICYATQNRQDAVMALAKECDFIFVVGAPHSSNSRRLVEVAKENGCAAQLIETPEVVKAHHLKGARRLGLTASASAPEHLVQGTIKRLRALCGALTISEIGDGEDVTFRLPPELTPSVGG